MTIQAILAPVFVQVFLTFGLLIFLGRRRFAEIGAGRVRIGEIALGERNWPPKVQAAANAFSNQFEIPLLFFALVPLALYTRKADLLFVVLAWLFVATRAAHAYIFVTSNHVPTRFRLFMAGIVILGVMWLIFAWRILLTPLAL
ncbi:MAPEG family protein [Methylobacterium planeticum]|uniref:MAPEG family protein n=1 Tax=Methylobacterium planeticum TaxID=2615211 RepID=A0A6N6MX58_9HYPH|nr:MAPEG family protein [Methylobacterium planeticum]KAB1076009.1 MAPEG family protein [Methylobacterium planeticum]